MGTGARTTDAGLRERAANTARAAEFRAVQAEQERERRAEQKKRAARGRVIERLVMQRRGPCR